MNDDDFMVIDFHPDPPVKKLQLPPSNDEVIDKERQHREKVDRLETVHSRRLMELRSAQRTLASYRKAHQLYTLMIVAWVALTSLGGLMIVVSPRDPASWIFLFGGAIATAVSAVAKKEWYSRHRLKSITRKRNGYSLTESVDYLDPELNVELAELSYVKSLRELSEETGRE